MSNMKYDSELYIITQEFVDGSGKRHNADKPLERVTIPVHSFEVEGGANRKINLASTNDVTVALEFEQARAYTNFIFYIPPTKDFLAVKLMDFEATRQLFDLTFVVNMYSYGKKVQTLRLSSGGAVFREKPIPVGGALPLLMMKVRMTGIKLLHGQFDPKHKRIINKEI